jgi:spermidine synthase
MYNTISSAFKFVVSYPYMMPSFHAMHSFILASKELAPQTLDLGESLQNRDLKLQYLSPSFLQTLFRMPGYVEEAYGKHQELITDAKPTPYET